MVARIEIPNPNGHAEDQLLRMEVEAEGEGESSHFILARFSAEAIAPGAGSYQQHIGREIYVERSLYGGLRYRRYLDCGWFDAPEWAWAHLTREEAYGMLVAFFSQGVEA